MNLLPPPMPGSTNACPGCYHYKQMLRAEEERWQPAWQAFHWAWALGAFFFVIMPVLFGFGTRLWTWALS